MSFISIDSDIQQDTIECVNDEDTQALRDLQWRLGEAKADLNRCKQYISTISDQSRHNSLVMRRIKTLQETQRKRTLSCNQSFEL